MKHGLWFALLAACSGGGGNSGDDTTGPDAPGGDATPTTGTVAIKIINPGVASVANLPISVAGPDGTVVSLTQTDATGNATATVTAGDSVTYAIDAAMIVTQLDVHPGDTLTVDMSVISPVTPAGAYVNVSAMSNASADSYKVSAGGNIEGDIAPPALLKLRLDEAATRYDLLGYAYESGQTAPIAFVTDFDLAPPSGSIPTVALGGWRTDFDTITVGITNAPAHAVAVDFELLPFIGTRAFTETTAKKMFSGSVGLENIVAKGEWTSYLYRTALESSSAPVNFVATTAKIDRLAQLEGLVSLDGGAQLLPYVASASVDIQTGHATPTLHIASEAATATAPTGFLAQFVYKNAAQQDITEIVVAPPGTSWDLPHMGDNQATYAAPTTGFAATLTTGIAAAGTIWPDAAAFRSNWLTPVTNPLSIQGSLLLSRLDGQ